MRSASTQIRFVSVEVGVDRKLYAALYANYSPARGLIMTAASGAGDEV